MLRAIEKRLTHSGIEQVNITLFLILAIAILLRQELYFDYVSDDAFISFRYARNFAEGYGLVYNPGEKVEGYTNFLWVLMLSAFHRLGLDMVSTARALGAIFSVATLLLTFGLSSLIFGGNHFTNLLAPFFLVFNSSYAAWATSGMETLLFAFLITSAVYRYIREQREAPSFPISAILLALASLTRPEGVLCWAVTFLHRFATRIRRGGPSKEDMVWMGTFLGIFLPYFVWRYWYYGFLFPNSYYAKVGGGFHRYVQGLRYITGFATTYGSVFLIPLTFLTDRRSNSSLRYLLLLVGIFVVYFVYVGGNGPMGYRFFVPILPLMGSLIRPSLWPVSSWFGDRPRRRRFPLLANLLGFGAVLSLIWLPTLVPPARAVESKFIRESRKPKVRAFIGKWLHDNIPGEATIAVNVAGVIPYYSRLKTIDMLGINDVHIAHTPVQDMGQHIAGHEKRDPAYVLARRPTIILPVGGLRRQPRNWTEWLETTNDSWFPGNAELIHAPDLRKLYAPRSVAFARLSHYLNFFQVKSCDVASKADERIWEFDVEGDPQGWVSSACFEVSRGVLTMVSGDNVTLDSPQFTLWATPGDVISLRMKSDAGEQGQVFWRTGSDPAFDQLKSHRFKLILNGRFHTYRFHMKEALFWAGTITQLRLVPTDEPAKIEIDYIKVEHCPSQ